MLSLMWCGLGQAYNGHGLKALVLMIFAALLSIVAGFSAIIFFSLPSIPAEHEVGEALTFALFLLIGLWIFAVADAYFAGRSTKRTDDAIEREPLVAALLSFIWSGVGQIYNQQISKGFLLMALLPITAITSIILYYGGMLATIAGLIVNFVGQLEPPSGAGPTIPPALQGLTTVGAASTQVGDLLRFAALGLWIFGIADAYSTANRRRPASEHRFLAAP